VLDFNAAKGAVYRDNLPQTFDQAYQSQDSDILPMIAK